ncbi:MAG TPA: hypothetical protein VI365_28405 [Trebonia sp.]
MLRAWRVGNGIQQDSAQLGEQVADGGQPAVVVVYFQDGQLDQPPVRRADAQ